MSVLVVPPVHGLGTPRAESLLSIVSRAAQAYGVRPFRLSRLVASVGRDSKLGDGVVNSSNGFISCSDSTLWLTSGFELLSGRGDVKCTTLLKLRSVLGSRARGIVARHYRVCPLCLDPKDGLDYSLLAHQLHHVTTCPIHSVALLEQCKRCGVGFSNSYGPSQTHCLRCCAPLWIQRAKPLRLSTYAEWCQRQAIELVCFATLPETVVPDTWGELYCHGITRLCEALDDRYTRAERLLVQRLADHRNGSTSAAPAIESLLRLAAMQATTVVEMIKAPVESNSPRLFNIGGAKDAGRGRRNHPKQD